MISLNKTYNWLTNVIIKNEWIRPICQIKLTQNFEQDSSILITNHDLEFKTAEINFFNNKKWWKSQNTITAISNIIEVIKNWFQFDILPSIDIKLPKWTIEKKSDTWNHSKLTINCIWVNKLKIIVKWFSNWEDWKSKIVDRKIVIWMKWFEENEIINWLYKWTPIIYLDRILFLVFLELFYSIEKDNILYYKKN